MKKILIVIVALLLAGCGMARPVLYPNAQVQQVGEAQAQKDIDECTQKAEAYVQDNPAGDVAKTTAAGAVVGTAIGAAVGAITGDFGQGVAIGAASGGISGLFGGLFQVSQPSPVHKQFVERCLREKGYEPIGWK